MTDRIPRPRADAEISQLAHEFKTPLAAIAGFAELLQVRDDERTRQESPPLIAEAATRLSQAVDRLVEILLADPELAARVAQAWRKQMDPGR